MTLIVGWIYKENVYVTGDTVITRTYKNTPVKLLKSGRNINNPINENVIQVKANETKLKEQESLKIYEIRKNVIYAFAGNGQRGHDIAIFLRNNYEQNNSLSINLNSAVRLLGSGSVQCLLGSYEGEQRGQLVSLNCIDTSGNSIEHAEEDIVVLGTPYWGQDKYFLNRILNEVHTKCEDGYRRLFGFCSIIQSHIIRKSLINFGIGGIYCGICLGEKSYWTDNYLIVQYRYGKSDIHNKMLQRIKESNLTFVSLFEGKIASMFTRNNRIKKEFTIYGHFGSYSYNCPNDLFGISTTDWLAKYKNIIDQRLENLDIKYIIYIDKNVNENNRVVIAEVNEVFKEFNTLFWTKSSLKLLTGFDILYGLSPSIREKNDEIEWYN